MMEECTYPNSRFRHGDHIRLAWLYTSRMPPSAAKRRMVQTIRRYAAANGASEKFHLTITLAWMRLVAAARRLTPGAESVQEFFGHHPWTLKKESIFEFYSRERLLGERARKRWVRPDLKGLPRP
jgi:hypothetical protein